MDLLNFFDSLHIGRVIGFFTKNKNFHYPQKIATQIAQIACFNGKLPQGSPSSPIITNLICHNFDINLHIIAKKYRLDFSRYADDITFSTNDKHFLEKKESFFDELNSLIIHEGFTINENKTRIIFKDSQQKVTGLVVNKKVNVDKKYYDMTRAMANSLYKNGNFTIDGTNGTIQQLAGRFCYIDQIQKENNKKDGLKHFYTRLSGKEKEYQKFLFHKYFLSQDYPLILTEGKTDFLYINCTKIIV